MKKIILHSVSVGLSLIWLSTEHKIYNPVNLKGPEFLKFYLILLFGFYLSIILSKSLKGSFSNTTFYFMIFILILGIIKMIRGITLGKPIGYLVMILFLEIIIMVYCRQNLKHKKQTQ